MSGALGRLRLPPEEPEAGPWSAVRVEELARRLLAGSEHAPGRPWVVAVDGRGGAGKSTLAARLLPHLAPAAVVGTDDVAWHEPFFAWGHLLAEHVLGPLHAGAGVAYAPAAWAAHGRAGAIEVPAGLRAVVVEGTGANQRAFAHLVDRTVWVQTDHALAEERGIARDVEQGVNGDAEESRRFWHEWMAHELPFFARERPWQRADLVVAGTPVVALGPDELACAPGPLGPDERAWPPGPHGPDEGLRSEPPVR
ncbi:uridine kinase family protein [Actinotalea solisilvae]|uniref:uridine kinase family protein n=1 Tax=Actinotalea solisilvae TaxID=2072922 RepID=UPI0018F1FEB4|nr:hypothetical protein [Actinotalea solisilvae]